MNKGVVVKGGVGGGGRGGDKFLGKGEGMSFLEGRKKEFVGRKERMSLLEGRKGSKG